MVIGTFLIAINLSSAGKQEKEYMTRKDACTNYVVIKIGMKEMLKVIGLEEELERMDYRLNSFCSFYCFINTIK